MVVAKDVPATPDDAPPAGEIRVEVAERPEAVVVTLAGNLDVYTCPQLWRAVEPLLPGARDVVVDLRGVRFLDSAGLGTLVSLRNRLAPHGRRVGLACGRSARVIEIAGLAPAFVCEIELAAVLDRLRPTARNAGEGPPPP
jgi:anti-anti-sigma factor